jgi:predicted tellurium resistance membrane protein TerC
LLAKLIADFSGLLSISGLFTVLILTALEVVMGFDNLLYISIDARRAIPEARGFVRRAGTLISLAMSVVLLFVLLELIRALERPLFTLDFSWLHTALSGHALIVLFGGWMLIRTAIREINHMLSVDDLEHEGQQSVFDASVSSVLVSMTLMCLVFSFDTVVAAIAFTDNLAIMLVAVILAGVISILAADRVAQFLQKNRLYEVLGLFVLLLVGIELVAEGGHVAGLTIFGYVIEPIEKSTFYFLLASLVVVDVLQGKFQRKLDREKDSSG